MTDNVKLYKYLDVNGGLMMLRNSNLQFTNATRLNDPFDCHPALFNFSNAPEYPHNWPPKDFLVEKGKIDTEHIRNSTWICSLSKNYDSLLMWCFYCNYNGVCIGIDIEKAKAYLSRVHCAMTMGVSMYDVQYKDIIEKPDYFNDCQDLIHYQLTTKAKAWEYEQEVRLILDDPTYGYVPMSLNRKPKRNELVDWKEVRVYPRIGPECFDSIYLGINTDEKSKISLVSAAKKLNLDIKIYQMTIDPDAFRLRAELINV